jgi:hypothetical protein
MTSLFDAPEVVGASRVKGVQSWARRVSKHRENGDKLVLAGVRTLRGRRLTDEERRELARGIDVLRDHRDDLVATVTAVERVARKHPEPRIEQRARKRR